jgi:hypothetical protein
MPNGRANLCELVLESLERVGQPLHVLLELGTHALDRVKLAADECEIRLHDARISVGG